MAVAKTSTWRSIMSCCYEPDFAENESSSERISHSDLSDQSSRALSEEGSMSPTGLNLHIFTLSELKVITESFSSSNLIGSGGFGPVFKGIIGDDLRPGLLAQPVAVKVLDLHGTQGDREWLTEVKFLGLLRHRHLVKLIGYCSEEEQRLLVYEYMPRGSLENKLFARFSILPWSTRMKIAFEAAKGLKFLHEAESPVIYRDFKASNILLDSDYTSKLSDFGLAKNGPEGDKTHVTTRVMGTEGYAAPEYLLSGQLTTMCDVYSFGVVLLELLTGRRSIDINRPVREIELIKYARPMLTNPSKLVKVMDPKLNGKYSEDGAIKAAGLAYNCLSCFRKHRPSMNTIVKILRPLKDYDEMENAPFTYTAPIEKREAVRENGS